MEVSRDLLAKILKQKRVLLLLDFDGTLCPLVSHANRARLTSARRKLLRELAIEPRYLAVISGRSLTDLQKRVALRGITYCGSFGLEMRGPKWKFLHPRVPAFENKLKILRNNLSTLLRDIPGIHIEGKKWSLTLHYRNVPNRYLPLWRARMASFRRQGGLRDFRQIQGDRAREIFPDVGWDKGDAALLLWHRMDKPYLLAIGNDSADEDMFRVIRRKGSAIRVGRKNGSWAPYYLRDVKQIYRFLEELSVVEPLK